MAKHISTSQIRSQLRSIESKARQAVNQYNREVRRYNSELSRAVSKYNSAVREYNNSVRRNRQIVARELSKLNSHTVVSNSYTVSLGVMQQHYSQVRSVYHEGVEVTPEQDRILDLIEQEQANSVITANVISSRTRKS